MRQAEREAGRLKVSHCRSDRLGRGGHTHLHDGTLRGRPGNTTPATQQILNTPTGSPG